MEAFDPRDGKAHTPSNIKEEHSALVGGRQRQLLTTSCRSRKMILLPVSGLLISRRPRGLVFLFGCLLTVVSKKEVSLTGKATLENGGKRRKPLQVLNTT